MSLGVHPVLRLQPLVDELVQQADVDRRLLVEGFCKIAGELCVVLLTPGNLGTGEQISTSRWLLVEISMN